MFDPTWRKLQFHFYNASIVKQLNGKAKSYYQQNNRKHSQRNYIDHSKQSVKDTNHHLPIEEEWIISSLFQNISPAFAILTFQNDLITFFRVQQRQVKTRTLINNSANSASHKCRRITIFESATAIEAKQRLWKNCFFEWD